VKRTRVRIELTGGEVGKPVENGSGSVTQRHESEEDPDDGEAEGSL